MKIVRTTIVALLSVLMAVPALAEVPAKPGTRDARLRTVTYIENEVIRVNGHYGFTTSLEFASYETIETVSIGDSGAWQVVKPDQPNILFIKPLEQQADTNLTIITSHRIYNFILYARQAQSHDERGLTFHVKFDYPQDRIDVLEFEKAEAERLTRTNVSIDSVSPDAWNFSYTYDGSDELRPSRVFDDGRFTYFAFPESAEVPAIFMVDEDRNESLVNHVTRGQYVVVESLGRQFTLRSGSQATCIFNDSFGQPEFDQRSPQQASARANIFSFLNSGSQSGGEDE